MIKNPYRKDSSIAFVFDEINSMPTKKFVEWLDVYSIDGEVIHYTAVRSYLARMKTDGFFSTVTRINKYTGKMKVMKL